MDNNIYLVTTVGVERDLELLQHFINHYREMGVEHFKIILHSFNDASARLRDAATILNRHGIRSYDRWITTNWVTRENEARQDQIIAGLPDGCWVVRADVDEFHEFPKRPDILVGELEQSGVNVVRGKLVDRVSRCWRLKPVRQDVHIFKQFPVKTSVNIGCRDKVLLHRKGVKLAAGHHFALSDTGYSLVYYEEVCSVHHCKWFAGVDRKYTDPALIAHHDWPQEYRENHDFINRHFSPPSCYYHCLRSLIETVLDTLATCRRASGSG